MFKVIYKPYKQLLCFWGKTNQVKWVKYTNQNVIVKEKTLNVN